MERESLSALARLIAQLHERLPNVQFYRFCQLLEQSQPEAPLLGSTWQVHHDPLRFRPHPGMGFPASEIKNVEAPEHPHLPPSLQVTFMGLYGVTSPLPTSYINDITQKREGYETTRDFLDIFNHRLITQYYRIWRKYSYPATFAAAGTDRTSQYLLSLAGLGIPGTAQHLAAPLSRFLALLPIMLLPGRTAEGIIALVKLLAPDSQATLYHHDGRRIALKQPLRLSTQRPVSLKHHPVMGAYAIDVNSQVLLRLVTHNLDEITGWLPGGELHDDLMALLHVYLGARRDVRLQLCVARHLLPHAALSCQPQTGGVMLARTALMRSLAPLSVDDAKVIINLGRFQHFQENIIRRESDEDGNYPE